MSLYYFRVLYFYLLVFSFTSHFIKDTGSSQNQTSKDYHSPSSFYTSCIEGVETFPPPSKEHPFSSVSIILQLPECDPVSLNL